MKKQKMRRATAICLALGMTFMSMGQAFANEETQTTETTTSVEWIDETEVESEVITEPETVPETTSVVTSELETVPATAETVQEIETVPASETEIFETESSESEVPSTEASETKELETEETEEETEEETTEEVIDREEDVVSQGVFFNDSLSEEQREQVLEEINQIERPENYLAGICNSQEECISYLRERMSWRYQYIEFKLYSNTYYADNDRANLWHDFLYKAWEHTGVSYEGDSIRYDYNAYDGGSIACEILGSNRYQYTFIYRISYKINTEQEQALRVAVRNKTAELCKGASSDYEKIRRIYDFICKTVSFDHIHGESYFLRYTAYAAMMNHTSVCQGYATLFYRMCLEAGIDARVVTSRSLGHSWNIVRLGNVYYYVDAAWDEYASKKSVLKKNLNWFLKSSADFPDHGNDKEVMSLMPLSSYPMSQKSYSVPKEDRMYVGLYSINGTWYYVEGETINRNFSELCLYNGSWYYVQNGVLNWDYTGLAKHSGNWYYVKNGCVDWTYTGLTQYYGTWYYVQKGMLKWSYTGLTKYNGTWYYIENSVLTWRYYGLIQYGRTWYYIEKSCLNWNYTGLVLHNDDWYYVQNGTLNRNYSGLTRYNKKWYYVEKGVLNWGYTGLVKYYETWYYVEKGVLNWIYTGLTKYYGTWYYMERGVLNWNYTGLTNYYGTWYYVEKGVLNWDYTGLTNYYGTWYYVEKGVLNRKYTGTITYNGVKYYVKNGIATHAKNVTVKFDNWYEGSTEHGKLYGVDDNGNTLWEYIPKAGVAATLSHYIDIGRCEDRYYFNEDRIIYCFDVYSGKILWINRDADFGATLFDDSGLLYVASWYGNTLCIISSEGKTLAKVNKLKPGKLDSDSVPSKLKLINNKVLKVTYWNGDVVYVQLGQLY